MDDIPRLGAISPMTLNLNGPRAPIAVISHLVECISPGCGNVLDGKVHVRPASSIFSNALNLRRSAIAALGPLAVTDSHVGASAPGPATHGMSDAVA
jgi:hypothetical protein